MVNCTDAFVIIPDCERVYAGMSSMIGVLWFHYK